MRSAFFASATFAQTPVDPRADAQIHLGPLYLTPKFAVEEFGIDTSVFNSANEKRDFTFTLAPHVDVWVPFARRALWRRPPRPMWFITRRIPAKDQCREPMPGAHPLDEVHRAEASRRDRNQGGRFIRIPTSSGRLPRPGLQRHARGVDSTLSASPSASSSKSPSVKSF